MYTSENFRSKKALKEAIKAGARITVFQPNNIFNTPIPENGKVFCEGPYYPEPHRWYAACELKDGYIVKVT